MRGRPVENVVKKMKYVMDYGDSKWHYDLNKHPNGPYLVEHFDPKYDKLEKLIIWSAEIVKNKNKNGKYVNFKDGFLLLKEYEKVNI